MPSEYSLSPVAPAEPGRLVVLGFADELSAFALRELLCELEEENIIEVGDAVVATRNAQGKVRLHQSMPLVATGAILGSCVGWYLGFALLNPIFGAVAGASTLAGAAMGAGATRAFVDLGIDDGFMKSLAETLTPGSSALFVFVHKTKPEPLLDRLKPFAGRCKILQSTMTAENESLLRALLEGELKRRESKNTTPAESKS
jgi:uncharacterized membrane protein